MVSVNILQGEGTALVEDSETDHGFYSWRSEPLKVLICDLVNRQKRTSVACDMMPCSVRGSRKGGLVVGVRVNE